MHEASSICHGDIINYDIKYRMGDELNAGE